jgi:regulatory protein
LATKPKLLELEGLMNFAARSLSARAQSSSELRTRLKRRAAHAPDVEQVLARLKDSGLINDQQFATAFTSWRKENQGFGKTRVIRDLMARRVAPALAKKAVDAAYENVDETAMIEDYLKRKYRGKDLGALLAEEKHLASAFRRLRAAGFSAAASIRTLKRYAALAERLEEEDLEPPPE